jgi:hypothetical protein
VPKEVQEGLDRARLAGLKKASRLRLSVDGVTYQVLRMWKTGFSIDAATAPHLRGLVDLYDGSHHLYQCLIIASEEEEGQMRYEFKRKAEAHDLAPLDFARDESAPVALIEARS